MKLFLAFALVLMAGCGVPPTAPPTAPTAPAAHTVGATFSGPASWTHKAVTVKPYWGTAAPRRQMIRPAVVGDACNPSACVFVADGTDDPCPNDGSVGCYLRCDECGPGQTCSEDFTSSDPSTTGTCGAQCGNGDVVCAPSTTECDLSGDCVPPCVVNGQWWVPPTNNCAGLETGLNPDGSTYCIAPCWYFVCSLVGGDCGF